MLTVGKLLWLQCMEPELSLAVVQHSLCSENSQDMSYLGG